MERERENFAQLTHGGILCFVTFSKMLSAVGRRNLKS
jgi:hypothetical protein